MLADKLKQKSYDRALACVYAISSGEILIVSLFYVGSEKCFV